MRKGAHRFSLVTVAPSETSRLLHHVWKVKLMKTRGEKLRIIVRSNSNEQKFLSPSKKEHRQTSGKRETEERMRGAHALQSEIN